MACRSHCGQVIVELVIVAVLLLLIVHGSLAISRQARLSHREHQFPVKRLTHE